MEILTSQTVIPEKKEIESEPKQEISEPKQEEKIPESEAQLEEIKESKVIEEPIQEQPLSDDSDPFEGIDSADINKYADLYDEPPPENDQQAKELSAKIKKWISDGRPKPN